MAPLNLKTITTVPTAKDFIDIVLSKTQRGTPTVVHNGWSIQRIRQFYMRKIKFTQQNWEEKLTDILTQFPKVEDIHPFYADLLNVLYDKDHYKLALGQLNTAKNLIDRIAQDYLRLVKYGDSLYRCKELKRAAMGRMCTLMKRHGASLEYLEQVRQHMSRLPSIDPNTRTLLLCGYPNVGKSSMINKLTSADVEVQPYAFTTKSLYVGHCDYKYLRWQVLDTPGILDRPLEERNTIEMQSITALAHLRAAVLYLVDISEQCGYTIAQQAALFHSIKPLFANKPVMIVCNKIDVKKPEEISEADRALIEGMVKEARKISNGGIAGAINGGDDGDDKYCMFMSTLSEDGVMQVKQIACERLLEALVNLKASGKKAASAAVDLHIVQPKQGAVAAAASRPPVIPAGVAEARARRQAGERKRTEKDLQEENGGAGVYSADLKKTYLLEDSEWKYDIIPEIMDGHNIIDFVDADIDAKLAELEREEDELEREHEAAMAAGQVYNEDDELTAEERADLAKIQYRKRQIIAEHRAKKTAANNNPVLPNKHNARGRLTADAMRESLGPMGINTENALKRMRSESRGRKRTREVSRGRGGERGGDDMDMEDTEAPPQKRVHSSKSRTMSRGRSMSLADPKLGGGLKDNSMMNKAIKMADRAQRRMNKMAKSGEADRVILTKMPKHLFSGKTPGHSTRNHR
eukprot:CAMPEP_0175061054 /NCGR_PEP_ID=MMETSP0052_2-20121109/13375_1 /TAXON_ID=51329 ORGANISM="Polytomella parva, Strain SAG 63-3" /NCGR_SAMPLE_ID=MMETSP0052_2 /ASSEMBLY_ACC=CAM_ASM_000194 /LENGTH=691 /DNA_ID=CAMNT_0016326873 /DNA_START=32 /DNA_END=2107 /DNA_ORIENTATION=-